MNVKIPKTKGEFRKLGIPIISDRIAQTVVLSRINKLIDPSFHEDSYGFRPLKSAHHALETARSRNFKYPFVIDLDIKGMFDNIKHEFILKALKSFKLEKWCTLYIVRWLEQSPGGVGTPQGGVISPVLANVFMDICFDKWMVKFFPNICFERYADDCIIHTNSLQQSRYVLNKIRDRFKECHISLNENKTVIATTKCVSKSNSFSRSYTFLGYRFKPRRAINSTNGKVFTGFLPAISSKAKISIVGRIAASNLFISTSHTIDFMAFKMNPIIRGWFNYYSKYNKSSMNIIKYKLDLHFCKFLKRKYKKIRSIKQAFNVMSKIKIDYPNLFYHWTF